MYVHLIETNGNAPYPVRHKYVQTDQATESRSASWANGERKEEVRHISAVRD